MLNWPEPGSEERDSTLSPVSRTTTDSPQSAANAPKTSSRTTPRTRGSHRASIEHARGLAACLLVIALGAGMKLQWRGSRGRAEIEVAGLGMGLGEGVLLVEEELGYLERQILVHRLVDDQVVGVAYNGHVLVQPLVGAGGGGRRLGGLSRCISHGVEGMCSGV